MESHEPWRVVPFEPIYLDQVVGLAEELLCREYAVQEDLSSTEDDDLRDIAGTYASPDGRFLLAVASGRLLATAGIRRLTDEDCELRRLYVARDSRRQGIASALVSELLPFVRERQYRRILLEVRPEMKDTVAGYSRYGFLPLGEGEDAPRAGQFLAIHL